MRQPRVTKRQALSTLTAVRRAFRGYLIPGEEGPTLVKNFDWISPGSVPWAIVWEAGPFEWTQYVPEGGVTEEDYGLGIRMTVSKADLPAGVHTEAVTGWALGVYLD